MNMNVNRREMLRFSALCAAGAVLPGVNPLSRINPLAGTVSAADAGAGAGAEPFVYKVGIWSSDFEKAKALGLDCIQISFPLRPNGGANDMRLPEVREKMLAKSAETGIEITSLAMGEFNGNPFWEIPDAVEQVSSCIDAMAAMNVKHVLISYFGKGHINTDEKYAETIRRYKELAPKAEEKGVVLAIEAPLKYNEHLRLVEGVNSPAVRIFYDPGNIIHLYGNTEGVCDDIRHLKGLIVAAHAKDSTVLGKGRIDYAKIFDAYRDAEYFGTQVLEGSVDKDLGWDESMRQSAALIRSLKR